MSSLKPYPSISRWIRATKGVTTADLEEQYKLAVQIRDKTSAANEAVIQIRRIREQVNERLESSTDPVLKEAADTLLEKTAAIEEELYQVKNRSGQDPLNFPIRLNNRLTSLRRSVETGDAKPTNGAYKVFEELTAELNGHLANLKQALDTDLAKVNQELQRLSMKAVETE